MTAPRDQGRAERSDTTVYRRPWRIDVTVRPGIRLPIARALLVRAIAGALDAAGAPSPATVGLILTDDREIARLNVQTTGQEGPTDVLSFPLLPVGAYPSHVGQDPRIRAGGSGPPFALPPGRRLHLGEIVISVERAIEHAQAGRGGQTGNVRWSPSDELCLLVTHGALHLCGWDHAEPEEEAAMRALERRSLEEAVAR